MNKNPTLSVARAAEIFEEALSARRSYTDGSDNEFFKASDVWKYLADGVTGWKINLTKPTDGADFSRRAGVVSVGDLVTLTVPQEIWAGAERGNGFCNHVLAHELGHLVCGHSAMSTRRFNNLAPGRFGLRIAPPNVQELEADYAGVFFQCGVELLNRQLDAGFLARKAFADPSYVRKAQMAVRLDRFQQLLNRPKPVRERVVL
jgi:hypothetical protein